MPALLLEPRVLTLTSYSRLPPLFWWSTSFSNFLRKRICQYLLKSFACVKMWDSFPIHFFSLWWHLPHMEVPKPGIKPVSQQLKSHGSDNPQSLICCATRECPNTFFFFFWQCGYRILGRKWFSFSRCCPTDLQVPGLMTTWAHSAHVFLKML